jgi:hypothetical protein
MDNTDAVNHPAHYNQFGVECIQIAEQMSFNRGNALNTSGVLDRRATR